MLILPKEGEKKNKNRNNKKEIVQFRYRVRSPIELLLMQRNGISITVLGFFFVFSIAELYA